MFLGQNSTISTLNLHISALVHYLHVHVHVYIICISQNIDVACMNEIHIYHDKNIDMIVFILRRFILTDIN